MVVAFSAVTFTCLPCVLRGVVLSQDPNSEETVAWVQQQTACFEKFMSRSEIREKIKKMCVIECVFVARVTAEYV